MQIAITKALQLASVLLAALLTACATTSGATAPWVESNNGRPVSAKRVPIGSDRILLLDAAAEEAAIKWMQGAGVESASIKDVDAGIVNGVQKRGVSDLDSSWYLVRAVGDGGGGVFSGFESGFEVHVVYNNLGPCKPLYNRVVAIRLDTPPHRVFADCGGGR
jgi:hypothetical protein